MFIEKGTAGTPTRLHKGQAWQNQQAAPGALAGPVCVFHTDQRFPTFIVAKSPIARLEALARKRGWRNLKMLSTAGNDYDHHYFGDTSKFGQAMRTERGYEPGKNWDEPMYNVFRKDADGSVRHFWGSEMLYVKEDSGQNHRAGDLVDPVWGLLDMSPEGRGDFFPKLTY